MQFSIKRDILLKSLNFVQGVVEKKNTLPILSNVLLEVKESSAASCGIDHGDWVLVQAQHHAENGQWVVALIDGYESTLKRYYNNDEEGICLMDDQADKDPIILDAARVMIQGVLIAKIRKYASDAHKVKV
mgnify:CR=1 FL=1